MAAAVAGASSPVPRAACRRVTSTTFTKVSNAVEFTLNKEDHTLGNLLRIQLLKDSRVLFAGYKMPHPMEHNFRLRIQTKGECSPQDALNDAINALILEVNKMEDQFADQVNEHQARHPTGMQGM